MKQTNFFKTMLLVGLLGGSSVIISCGGDDDEPSSIDPTKEIKAEEPSKDEAMSTEDLKARLEKIALEFMGEVPSSDFKEITDFGKKLEDLQSYRTKEIDNWSEGILRDLRKSLGDTGKVTDKTSYYSLTTLTTNYEVLLAAANFKAHFTTDDKTKSWVKSEGSDFQMIFNNKKSVFKVVSSGKEAKVYVRNSSYYNFYENNKTHTYVDTVDVYKETWAIPENITATITDNGKQLMKITMKNDISNLDGTTFDIAKSKLNTTLTIEMNNGYKTSFKQLVYNGNGNAIVEYNLSKNNKSLYTMSISGAVSGMPSANLADESSINTDKIDMQSALVKIDVLGQLQIQGTIKDVRKFSDALQNSAHNDGKEKEFKQYITEANSYLDVNLFLDNKNVKQANVSYEPFKDGKYWYSEPVLNFFDGSSFAAFSAFFNKKDFKKVIDKFDTLSDGYSNLGK